jgi:hypothetical protein
LPSRLFPKSKLAKDDSATLRVLPPKTNLMWRRFLEQLWISSKKRKTGILLRKMAFYLRGDFRKSLSERSHDT